MPVSVGNLELHVGPSILGGPDDLDEAIRTFIGATKRSLSVAVQELDSKSIASAILAAKAAHEATRMPGEDRLRVRVILEGDYLTEESAPADPWLASGANERNREIHAALLRAGVDVITDLNPKIFHQKFIVRDVGTDNAAVLTGSTNFTLTDSGMNTPANGGTNAGNNLNHVVVLRGRTAASQYEAEFDRMRESGTFGVMHERVESRPQEFRIGDVRVKPLFAPRHGPEMEIIKQMLKARDSIDFAMYTYASSSGIDDAMFRLRPGIGRMRGIIDRSQGRQTLAPAVALKAAGVDLHVNKKGTGVRKVHHKLMVVDERVTIVGSFNYTAPANTLNDENIIVIGDLAEEDGSPGDVGQREIAQYAVAEIDRMIADLGEPA
jgi:phosphatidylserine/phosphatidylglycerophosphate/cardiolipin synthase-like enzyme